MTDQSKRCLITLSDVEQCSGVLSVPENAIITPLALDRARQQNIRIVFASSPGPTTKDTNDQVTGLHEFCGRIDHTNLAPAAAESEIVRLCQEASRHGFAAACVNPTRVSLAARECAGSSVRVCGVAGFPSGTHCTTVKVAEAVKAAQDGAVEIDLVANAGLLADDDVNGYADDIEAVRRALGTGVILKVIIESSSLSERDIVRAAVAAAHAGADYVKTSTGVYGRAQVDHVRLLRHVLEPRIKIKAAGGINTREQALQFLQAGADRIGTSSAVEIVESWVSDGRSS